MADLDEYAFLEAAVDGKLPPPPGAEESKPRDSEKERSSKDKRHRSRSRSRDRKRSSRDRSRDRERDRSDRPSSRGDRGDRDRDRGRGDRREGDRRENYRRDRSPPRRRREPTPPEVRLAREKEKELKELERATRTIMAYNVNIKADERDIWEFFSKAGEVTDIRIITDRHTRRSKGIAYIEFSKQENVFTALAMTGQVFMGQAVMVKTAEAEKNVAWEAAQAAKANQSDAAALLQAAGLAVPPVAGAAPAGGGDDIVFVPIGPPVTLRVSGFPVGLGEAELRQVFQPFGQVSDVTMVKDAAGNESSADIVFSRAVEGQAAAAHWNGNVLIGGVLSVTVVGEPEPAVAALPPLPAAPGVAAMTAAMTGADVGELDEQEGGFKLNSVSRAALMSRLAGGADALPPAVAPAVAAAAAGGAPALVVAAGAPNVPPAVLMAQSALGPPSPIPTQCITLKNVWRGEQTAEPGWDSEVMDDMKDEASKCGQLLHVHLDPSSQGFVYMKFATPESAAAAHKLMNNRFYMGNMIIAEYQFVQPYNAHFGLA